MGSHHPIRKTVVPEIPDKLYFRIGDVARLCEVPAYVLRFWETEFPQLKPNKGGTGQRLYRRRDVEMALRIKNLLYDQGYTIPGARQVFKAESLKAAESKASETRTAVADSESRPTEAENAEPRLAEPRLTEPRLTEPRPTEPRLAEPRTFATKPREGARPLAQPSAPPPAEPADNTLAGLRRTRKLEALRADMAALLTLLSSPAGNAKAQRDTGAVQTLRPRLVPEKPEKPKARQLSLEGDLF